MTAATDRRFDVLMVTDCRFPGGTSSSVVEEIQAQARAGYRTGLLHLPSTVLGRPRPFNPKLRRCIDQGLVHLVTGSADVDAALLLARHPTVFTSPPASMPRVHAGRKLLAVNQVPADDRSDQPYYDVAQVEDNLERLFGGAFTWAPIGPRVRDVLAPIATDVVDLSPVDWENIIDVGMWQSEPRTGYVGSRPVIGRHSRGHWTKWPDDADDLAAAYPTDEGYEVRILGGVATPKKLLGGLPSNWVDHPFNSIAATDYLKLIDFCVYFHHPGLIEAFGRVPLEAMSAGAVCILPPYFERLFGDACLYGTPQDVRPLIDGMWSDWPAYAELSVRGTALARERFSYETHVSRIEALIGPPAVAGPAPRSRRLPAGEVTVPRHRVAVLAAVDPSETGVHGAALSAARAVSDAAVVVLAPDEVTEQALGAGCLAETLPWRTLLDAPAGVRGEQLEQRAEAFVRTHAPDVVLVIADSPARATRLATLVGGDLEVVTVSPGSRSALPDDPASATTDLLDVLTEQLPAGWRVRYVAPSSPGGTPTAGGDTPSGWRTQLGERLPWLRHTVWAARRRGRHGRAWVQRNGRRAKAKLVPAVHWAREQRAGVGRRAPVRLTTVTPPALPIPLGTVATHPDPERLPTVAVLAPEGGSVDLLELVAEIQQITASFRPVLLGPAAWRALADNFGYRVETVLTPQEWVGLRGADGWAEHVAERVAFVQHTYDPDHLLTVPAGGSSAVAGITLRALLEAVGRPPEEKK